MRTRTAFLSILFGCLSLTACMVGDQGDGTDTSDSDYTYCAPRQIDSNADGRADGLDINCDGVIDFHYQAPPPSGGSGGGGTGTHNQCSTMLSVNGVTKAISCTGDGSTTTCECRVNGTLQNTCTQSSTSCSAGYPNANCCGF